MQDKINKSKDLANHLGTSIVGNFSPGCHILMLILQELIILNSTMKDIRDQNNNEKQVLPLAKKVKK